MLKKWSMESASTILAEISISQGSSRVAKYIARPARIDSRVFGMAEEDAAAFRDPVDRPLEPGGELHHEQRRLVVAEQLDQLLEAQRLGDAGPVLQQLLAPVGACGQDPEPTGARTRRPA